MLFIYRLCLGYVRVLFYGEFYEKILNLTARNRITLWDSRLVKNGIESSVSVKDFKRLKDIMKNSGIRVHILKKHGLPFKVAKNKKRAGLVLGALFFLGFLELMSGYIWVIDVEGNEYVKTETILNICREIGIEEGIKKANINPKSQRQQLLLKTDELAWASLNIEGSRLTVNVSEVQRTDKNTDAYNLKADEDGIITKIDVTNGTCVVSVGDAVKKGDLLVSGVVEESGKTKFVNSTGKIYAETAEEIFLEEKYVQINNFETGREKTRYVLELFSLKFPLYLGSVKGEYCTETDSETVKLFGTTLPIKIFEKKFTFVEKEEINLSKDELIALLKKKALAQTEKMKSETAEVLAEEFTDLGDGVSLKMKIKSVKDITVKEPMLIGEGSGE